MTKKSGGDNYLHVDTGASVARIFQRGGGVILCHTQGTYQIFMLISMLCFTKSDIFWMSSEHEGRGKPTK